MIVTDKLDFNCFKNKIRNFCFEYKINGQILRLAGHRTAAVAAGRLRLSGSRQPEACSLQASGCKPQNGVAVVRWPPIS